MTTIPQTPILGHVEGVELIDTGSWLAMTGPATFTPNDLASAVAALDCPSVRRPVLKAGHKGETGDVGEPALGYVDNLRTANEGQTLVGDYRGMPGWLTAVDDNGQSILASAYADRSIEGEFGYHCALGHTHPFVVHAVALLGVELPAIGTLQTLQEMYGVVAATKASEDGRLVTLTHRKEAPVAKQINAAATTDDVRRAYYEGAGADWDIWIREMYVDPPELIVDNDADGSILRVPYTISSKGDVTFGEPQKVKVTYVAARATSGSPVESFATRAESRPGSRPAAPTPKTPVAASVPGATPTGEEPAVAFSDEQIQNLRKLAGVAEDADEATIMAALDQAVGEASPDPTPQPNPSTDTAPTLPVAASTGKVPEGIVMVDADTLRQIQEQGRQGAAAAARLAKDDRNREITKAVELGKFAPARRQHWETLWDNDPEGTKAALASMPANMVPVHHVGEPGDPDGPDYDAEFTSMFPPERKV